MAENTIYDYDAAITIDGSSNWLLLQPGNNSTTYKRINRETFLGVTGQPADISTAQNITNKTLDNTNTATLRDDRFTLQDSGDVTRQATFQLSGITAGNTRVMTLPDASTTLVGTGTTQTLTNKTLTSPAITGGSITNSTISVDAISEYTSANGVTVDGLNIKDGKLNTNNSVITANITDGAVTPAKLVSGSGTTWVWQSWTPTFTNFTKGSATIVAKYIQVGKWVKYQLTVTLAADSSMGSIPTFTLPITSVATPNSLAPLGWGTFVDASGGPSFVNPGIVSWTSTTVGTIRRFDANNDGNNLSSTQPFTWTTNDAFCLAGEYEAA